MGAADRLVIALDDPGRAGFVAEKVCGRVWGVKLGLPLAIAGVLGGVARSCRDSTLIVDLKLADVGHVMAAVVRALEGLADAVIAHSFVGYEGALETLTAAAREAGMKVILVYTMSHRGAMEAMVPCRGRLAEVIRRADPWGVVAPATRPWEVEEARRLFPGKAILSPGVGLQGGRPGDALCAGADYEIVGRAVASSPNPGVALERLEREIEARGCVDGG